MTDSTLRELLRDLSQDPAAQAEFGADPDGYLAAQGFDLSPELLGEAIVNASATLPPETAEHLSPFTVAHSPIPQVDEVDGEGAPDAAAGLELLAGAPALGATPVEEEGAEPFELGGFGDGSSDEDIDFANSRIDVAPESDDFDGPDGAVSGHRADLEFDDADLNGEPAVADDGFADDAAVDGLGETDPADLDDLDGFE